MDTQPLRGVVGCVGGLDFGFVTARVVHTMPGAVIADVAAPELVRPPGSVGGLGHGSRGAGMDGRRRGAGPAGGLARALSA